MFELAECLRQSETWFSLEGGRGIPPELVVPIPVAPDYLPAVTCWLGPLALSSCREFFRAGAEVGATREKDDSTTTPVSHEPCLRPAVFPVTQCWVVVPDRRGAARGC